MTTTIERPQTEQTPSQEQSTEWDTLKTSEISKSPSKRKPAAERMLRFLSEKTGNVAKIMDNAANKVNERAAEKAAQRERMRQTFRELGSAAKSGAEKAGKKVVGAGIATTEAVIGTGVIGAKFARKKVENALNTTKEVFNNSKDAVTNRIDEAKTNRESKLAERELRQKERQEQRRKEVQMKRDAALARKQERRDRWSARINSAKETVSGGIENARKKIHVIRAVGAEAIRAGREAYNTHTEQNELQ